MPASRSLAILGLATLMGSDPVELVHRLSAPKYADRQAASAEIERVGVDALPALRAVKASADAEVRARAGALLTRIENDLLIRPTMVSLDFREVPLSRAISLLAERGHISLGLTPNDRASGDRVITLVESQPVPLWEAVEKLGHAGHVELSGGPPVMGFGAGGTRLTPLVYMDSLPGAKLPPISISGPYRISLLALNYHKEKSFVAGGPNNGMGGFAPNDGFRIQPQGIGFGNIPGMAGGNADQFSVNLQIQAEPRMNIAMNGLPRLVEAIDDRNNVLIPPVQTNAPLMHNSGYSQFSEPGGPLIQTSIALRFPERAGKKIKRLHGIIPLTVTSRKADPLMIPLADAKGKTYHAAELSITVNDVRLEPNFGQTTIDLTIQPEASPADQNGGGFGVTMPILRAPGSPQNPLEIVDAQGRPSPQWHLTSHMPMGDASRITIRMMPSAGVGPATHLRYHDLSRVNVESEFDFVDVEMP